MALGASAQQVISEVGASLLPIVAVGVAALALIGAVVWLLLRRRRRAPAGEPVPIVAWADAACPACLVLAAIPREVAD